MAARGLGKGLDSLIPNTIGGDGEEIDAHVIGEFEPLETFCGYVVAIIHREDDV